MITLGAYVPLTKEGTIMVNGILASSYASFDHDIAHIGMTPIQWIPEIVEWFFGEDNGLLTFVSISKEAARLILPIEQLWQY